jgi:hypothetical protein
MINIVKAKHISEYKIEPNFSDETHGVLDFSYIFDKKTALTIPLENSKNFQNFFLDFGALCFKNGLEFCAESLQIKLKNANLLHSSANVA